MRKVAFQPAGSPASRGHYKDTIEHPVKLADVSRFIGPESSKLKSLFPSGSAAMWGVTPDRGGANVPKYGRLEEGDIVLFLRDKRAYSLGRVALKFQSESLAEHLWGRDDSSLSRFLCKWVSAHG